MKLKIAAGTFMLCVLSSFLTRFRRDQSGASMIEYGLIVAAIGSAMITAMHALSSRFADAFGLLIEALF